MSKFPWRNRPTSAPATSCSAKKMGIASRAHFHWNPVGGPLAAALSGTAVAGRPAEESGASSGGAVVASRAVAPWAVGAGAPQRVQNRSPAANSWPHFEQYMADLHSGGTGSISGALSLYHGARPGPSGSRAARGRGRRPPSGFSGSYTP